MSKKEELLKRLCKTTQLVAISKDEFGYHGEITQATMSVIYDEIRASILTPKVAALIKAIGSRPEKCNACLYISDDGRGYNCPLLDCYPRLSEVHYACPLLTAEELKEVTE